MPASTPTAASAATVVSATLAGQALASMAILILPAIAPTYAQALAVDPSLIGYQVSLMYAAAMASVAFGGSFVKIWGAGRTTQISMALTAAGASLAMVANLSFLVLGSLLMGLGYGLTNPAASHLLVRFTPEARRNLIFSIKQTGVPLGGIAAALIAPALAVSVGWPWALALVAAACLGFMAVLQRPRARWDNDRDPSASIRQMPLGGVPMIWRHRPLRLLALTALAFAGVQLCVMAFTVTLLVKEAGYGLVQAGLLLSLTQLAGFIGRPAWGWLADRSGSVRVLIILGVIMLGACLAVTRISGQWPALAIQLVFLALGATAIGWNGVFLAEVARLAPPGQAGLATGGALFFTFAGVLLGPPLFSALYRVVGSYTLTFALAAAIAAAGLVSLSLLRRAPC